MFIDLNFAFRPVSPDINVQSIFSGVLWADGPRQIIEEATDLKLDISCGRVVDSVTF